MDLILLAVIVLQFAYNFYSDHQNRLEREKLQLKMMSKDINDYTSALTPPVEETRKVEEDPYMTIEEAGIERIVRAREV